MTDKYYIDDRIVPVPKHEMSPIQMLNSEYVYQTVNTLDHRPILLSKHLRRMSDTYAALYGTDPELQPERISRQISNLLGECFYPRGGNLVDIMLMPGCEPEAQPTMIIAPRAHTLYHGYALVSLRPKCLIANYEIPFERHMTSFSRQAASFMDAFAARKGMQCAIRANRKGMLVSCSDSPLFLVKGYDVLTLPVGEGGRESVERELALSLASMSSVSVREEGVNIADLRDIEEMFFFSALGITSIRSCNGRPLHTSVAMNLEDHLSEFNWRMQNAE